MIYEKAYAKVNLALEVGDVVDGYHKVQNLMVPISLYDELFFEKSIETKIESEFDIADNICIKAFNLFKKKYNVVSGVTIILKKNIPIMAGLAGGSTDAAATLRGLNRLFEINASVEELYELACQLGSDVPFFLYNKPALCTGRGEVINPLDIEFKDVPFLIMKPKFGLSTKEIYSNYHYHGINKSITIDKIIKSMKEKKIEELDQLIFNDLEPVALGINQNLKDIFSSIERLSYNPHISGSGPSIFILNAKAIDMENIGNLNLNLDLFLCHTI